MKGGHHMAQARKGKDNPAAKILQEQREARAKAMAEPVKRMESTQPTPTQEENDLARLGMHVDEKEDDGSGQNVIVTPTVLAGEPLGPLGYPAKPKEHE